MDRKPGYEANTRTDASGDHCLRSSILNSIDSWVHVFMLRIGFDMIHFVPCIADPEIIMEGITPEHEFIVLACDGEWYRVSGLLSWSY